MASKKSTPPLLIFDFDGTLADTLEAGVEIFNQLGPEYGLREVDRDELEELRHLNTRALLAHLGISRVMALRLATSMRKRLSKRMKDIGPIPGIMEAVKALHESERYGIGILSSNSSKNIKIFLKRHGARDCFGFIEAGTSLFGKGRRLRSLLKKLKCEPEEVAYIGDETRDIEAAREVGVHTIAVCWGANGKEAMLTEDPDFCIEKPEELSGALESLFGSADGKPAAE